MNRATENLENDHIHILRLTEVMMNMSKLPELDPVYIDEVTDLIRNFADGLHHAKEENILFPLMADRGFSVENGPVAVMLAEHEEGREHVRKMMEGSSELRKGNMDAVMQIRESLAGYANLLQNHISKENNILFRMADNLMSDSEEASMFSTFQTIDSGNIPGSSATDFITRIEILTQLFRTK